jgi:hypothetical protein
VEAGIWYQVVGNWRDCAWVSISQMWTVFYNKLSWFVSELPEKDISNVVVQCR